MATPARKITARQILAEELPRTPTTSVRMPPTLKEVVKRMAVREHRNLSAQCLHMLTEAALQELNREGAA